jgi:hypothetical protein
MPQNRLLCPSVGKRPQAAARHDVSTAVCGMSDGTPGQGSSIAEKTYIKFIFYCQL